jgi:U3 small nucleolar RNA-associated protein 19
MPAVLSSEIQSSKRKRVSSAKKPVKRARSESSDDVVDAQAQILLLENEIFESKKNYNNIAKLVALFKDDTQEPDDSVVAAISLCRVFTRLLVAGEFTFKAGTKEKDLVVLQWLKDRYLEYKEALLDILGEEGISTTVLTLCLRLLKTEGENIRNNQEYQFPTLFLTGIMTTLLDPASDGEARKEFSEKFVEEYDDIRFYTLEAIQLVLEDNFLYFTNATKKHSRGPRHKAFGCVI